MEAAVISCGEARKEADMERLTDKRLAIPPGQWQEVTREEARELKEIPIPLMRDLYYRLSQIEDVLCDDTDEYDLDRLSVLCNQRMSMRDEVSQRFSLTAKIPLDRLRELVEMDSAGCIPPCKIGDVFYRVYYGFNSPEIEKYRVSMVTQKADGSWRIRATDTESSFQIDWSLDDFSKRAYKTREEAEAALAKIAD